MNKSLINENNMINNLIKLIDDFSIIIYNRENNETYQLLINIIDKLDSIIGGKSILEIEDSYKMYIRNLAGKLPDLLDAFENNDNVLIGDILRYEIKPLLENLLEMIL